MDKNEKIHQIVEGTDLYIEVTPSKPNLLSNFKGRALEVNLEKGIVIFDQKESLLREGKKPTLLNTSKKSAKLNNVIFSIRKGYCEADGTWEKWYLHKFDQDVNWDNLHQYLLQTRKRDKLNFKRHFNNFVKFFSGE